MEGEGRGGSWEGDQHLNILHWKGGNFKVS